MSWFIMLMVSGRLMYIGPFSETECKATKQTIFSDTTALCVERRIIDVRRPA